MEEGNSNEIFSKRIRAGSRRTYFLDVRATKSNDYYLTITESKKRFNDDGYERHKLFLYKEDFNKFIEALNETVNYVKTELLPDYDFDEFSHKDGEHYKEQPVQESKPKLSEDMPDKLPDGGDKNTEETTPNDAAPVVEAVGEEVLTPNSDPKVTQEADDLKWD